MQPCCLRDSALALLASVGTAMAGLSQVGAASRALSGWIQPNRGSHRQLFVESALPLGAVTET
jgi:hypothetical protein